MGYTMGVTKGEFMLFEINWWNGEEWCECEMEGDRETIRETFLNEEKMDGNTVENLTITES